MCQAVPIMQGGIRACDTTTGQGRLSLFQDSDEILMDVEQY